MLPGPSNWTLLLWDLPATGPRAVYLRVNIWLLGVSACQYAEASSPRELSRVQIPEPSLSWFWFRVENSYTLLLWTICLKLLCVNPRDLQFFFRSVSCVSQVAPRLYFEKQCFSNLFIDRDSWLFLGLHCLLFLELHIVAFSSHFNSHWLCWFNLDYLWISSTLKLLTM